MRRWLFIVLAGCGFRGAPFTEHLVDAADLPIDGSTEIIDAREVADAPGAVDAMADAPNAMVDAAMAMPDAMTVAPFCDPSDASLVACYAFEGNLADGSGQNHTPSTAVNTSFAAGKVGNGLVIGNTTEVDVPDSPAFDVAAVTIEAWVKPNLGAFPTGRGGVLDCNNQYGMFVLATGLVTCTASSSVTSPMPIASGSWSHVACTENGTTVALYVNGSLVASGPAGTLPTSATTGFTLGGNNPPGGGDPLVGMLDQVRLFKVARTAAQICGDAGKSGCP